MAGATVVTGLGMPDLVLLAALGLVCGIGITALGPGGVLASIALFALTGLTPAQVAGTAIVTHIATGALGTAVYTRSGQLRDPGTRRTALLLAGAALAGTPIGVLVNTVISGRTFGLLLGVFVAGVATLVLYRQRRPPATRPPAQPRTLIVVAVGVGVAAAAGMFGIGGPMLTVPLLVALRVPILSALAAAQAQSVIIASIGTVGYLTQGAVNWPLAALVGVPELAGVLFGWAIARALPTRTLTYALIYIFLGFSPYLDLHR